MTPTEIILIIFSIIFIIYVISDTLLMNKIHKRLDHIESELTQANDNFITLNKNRDAYNEKFEDIEDVLNSYNFRLTEIESLL